VKSWDRAKETHLQIVDRFMDLAGIENNMATMLKKELVRYMNTRLQRDFWLPPEITRFHTEWYREFYRVTGTSDPYKDIKERSNYLASQIINQLIIKDLHEAVNASIIGNKLDFGVIQNDPERMPIRIEDFQDLSNLPFLYNDYSELEAAILTADKLIYLVDNNGEVLFDRLVIEKIKRLNSQCLIYVAGKSSPMLNDVTVDELAQLGFKEICEVISTGSNCFGVPADEISEEFRAVLQEADVIIAKGQAYFEFWTEYSVPNVYNLLHTKIPIIVSKLGGEIPVGKNVIISSKRY